MVCECDDPGTHNYARYYDTPDGCDMKTKIQVATRYGVVTGLVLGTYDVMMYSHAVGLGRMLARYAMHVVPLGLMGATFAAVANTVQHVRDEDDVFNYFIGGAACSPILAHYLGSKHALFLGALGLGVIGMIKKNAIDNGYTIFPDVKGHMGLVNSWRNDWTLSPDPRDKWIADCGKHTTDKESQKNKKP